MSRDGLTRAYVWQQDTGSNRLIKTTYTVDGGATEVSRDLSPAATNSFMPQVAVSSDGSALVYAWGNRSSGNAEATFSVDRGASWTDVSLGRQPSGWEDPRAAVSDNGQTIAFLWTYDNGTNRFVRIMYTHDAGSVWTTKDLTHPTTGDFVCYPEVETPRLAVSADGTALAAAWNCLDNVGTQGVYSSDGGVTWLSNWTNGILPDTNPGSRRGGDIPSVAIGGAGASMTIAYAYRAADPADATKISVSTLISGDKGSSWRSQNLSTVGAAYPRVAVSADGGTLVYAWTVSSTIQTVISHDRGLTGLTSVRPLGDATAVPASVGASGDGMTLAYTWRGWDGTNTRALGTVTRDGGVTGLDVITPLSAAGGNASTNAQVAVSGDGGAIAYVWERDGIVQTTYSPAAGPAPDPNPTPPGPAPAPAPDPTPSSTATATPTATPTPAPTQSVDPATQRVVNGEAATLIAGAVSLVDAATAAATPDRHLKKPPATKLRTAPRVTARAGRPTSLVLSVGTRGTDFTMQVKIGGSYRVVGTVTSDGHGKVSLPVMRFDKAGTYTVALVSPTGAVSYVKIVVS